MKKIVKNGTIVTPFSEYKADILVDGEKIAAIGKGFDETGCEVIDAAGMYVLPGGVDQHAHWENLNTDGLTASCGYEGTWPALLGGTTTIIDFAGQEPGMGLIDSAKHRIEKRAAGKLGPDLALHALCTNFSEDVLNEVKDLPAAGLPTIKLFMAYKPTALYSDDTTLFRMLREAGKAGVTVMLHAENADVLNLLRDEAAATGHLAPIDHVLTRPVFTEVEAVQRAITLADAAGCPICILHVSCEGAARGIQNARNEGKAVIGETCTHYLTLDKSCLETDDFDQACRFVCSPPLRDKSDQDYLWKAINRGWLSVVASDHAAIPLEQKQWGRTDFRKIINGSPGAGDRLQLMWTYGVEKGRISRSKLVELYATVPAKINGLYPRKGAIEVGSDADIVVYNPDYRGTFTLESNPTGLDFNTFEGMEQVGRAETVLLRGNVVVKGHKFVAEMGCGKFIPGEGYGLGYDLL